jgi:hypothetical protein
VNRDPYSYLWESYSTVPKPQPKAHVEVFRSLNCWNYTVNLENPPAGWTGESRYQSCVQYATEQGAEAAARRSALEMLRRAKNLINPPVRFTLTLDDVA